MMSAFASASAKPNGTVAGTPPMSGGSASQTAAPPSPSGRETMIWKSGRPTTLNADADRPPVLAGARLDDEIQAVAEEARRSDVRGHRCPPASVVDCRRWSRRDS
jgi:hypothetical protein